MNQEFTTLTSRLEIDIRDERAYGDLHFCRIHGQEERSALLKGLWEIHKKEKITAMTDRDSVLVHYQRHDQLARIQKYADLLGLKTDYPDTREVGASRVLTVLALSAFDTDSSALPTALDFYAGPVQEDEGAEQHMQVQVRINEGILSADVRPLYAQHDADNRRVGALTLTRGEGMVAFSADENREVILSTERLPGARYHRVSMPADQIAQGTSERTPVRSDYLYRVVDRVNECYGEMIHVSLQESGTYRDSGIDLRTYAAIVRKKRKKETSAMKKLLHSARTMVFDSRTVKDAGTVLDVQEQLDYAYAARYTVEIPEGVAKMVVTAGEEGMEFLDNRREERSRSVTTVVFPDQDHCAEEKTGTASIFVIADKLPPAIALTCADYDREGHLLAERTASATYREGFGELNGAEPGMEPGRSTRQTIELIDDRKKGSDERYAEPRDFEVQRLTNEEAHLDDLYLTARKCLYELAIRSELRHLKFSMIDMRDYESYRFVSMESYRKKKPKGRRKASAEKEDERELRFGVLTVGRNNRFAIAEMAPEELMEDGLPYADNFTAAWRDHGDKAFYILRPDGVVLAIRDTGEVAVARREREPEEDSRRYPLSNAEGMFDLSYSPTENGFSYMVTEKSTGPHGVIEHFPHIHSLQVYGDGQADIERLLYLIDVGIVWVGQQSVAPRIYLYQYIREYLEILAKKEIPKPRGGYRKGAGRPSQFGEKSKQIRVPERYEQELKEIVLQFVSAKEKYGEETELEVIFHPKGTGE